MKEIDRRRLLGGILCGAAAAAAGLTLTSAPSEAMPFDARVAGSLDGMVEKAQVVVVKSSELAPRVVLATVITAAGVAGGIEVDASVAGVDARRWSDPRYPRRAAPIAGLRPTSWATMTRWLRS